ncbi:MAG: universal stress protein [Actinobacteria bacterium]|nr:universal stress protein [Actinomycetota bacterium]
MGTSAAVRRTPALICGVDDSDEARAAARLATRLADALGLRLVFAHVVTHVTRVAPAAPAVPAGASGAALSAYEEVEAAERERAEEVLDAVVREAGAPADVERRLAFGWPVEKLIELVHQEAAELVVVGAPRDGRVVSAVRGTVAIALARKAPCAVVVVPTTRRREHDWV